MAASYTDNNYCGTNATYGATKCKWKPRKVSAKRDFPDAFKKQKVIEVQKDSADKGLPDFIPLESCGSDCDIIPRIVTETRGLDTADGDKRAESDAYDIIPRIFNIETHGLETDSGDEIAEYGHYGIIPRIVGTETRGLDKADGDKRAESDVYDIIPRIFNVETHGLETGSGDEIAKSGHHGIIPCIVGTERRGSDTIDGDGGHDEVAKSGSFTELIIPGVLLKAIKWYQMDDRLKIELSLDKLPKSAYNTCYKSVGPCKRRKVSAVRSFPPGCGLDAASVCS